MRFCICCAFCVLIVRSAVAVQAPILARQLSNGLQLLIIRDARLQSVEVDAGYLVGTVDDSLRGIAHLMEHVAMRETTNGRGLAARYGALNVSGGAFTTGRYTLFGSSGPGGVTMLDTLLSFQRQRMIELAVSDLAVTTERRSINTETGGRLQPDPWLASLFPNHRLRFGSSQVDLDRIGSLTLRGYYERYYTPRNAILLIKSALPDSIVIQHVTAAFGTLPPGPTIPTPVERDTGRIVTRSWSGTLPGSQRAFAATVPGIQHPWSQLLDAVVSEVRVSIASERPSVQIHFRNASAPARVLMLTTHDTLDAPARLARVWQALIARADSARVTATMTSGNLVLQILDGASIGDWRYAFGGDSVTPALRARVTSLLRGLASGDTSIVLWPSAARTVQTPTEVPTTAPPAERHWKAPSTSPVVQRRTAGGMEWSARAGGVDDSVYFAAVFAPRESASSPRAMAALEMWARLWSSLRSASGASVDSQFLAQGIRIAVRSLPYPVVATTDDFLALGVTRTPIGLYGIEFMVTAPRDRAPAVLTRVKEALANGTIDSMAFEVLRARQLELFRANSVSTGLPTEFAMRGALVSAPAGAAPRYTPAPHDSQAVVIRSLTLAEVRKVGPTIATQEAGRIAILGATEAAAQEWITQSGWESASRLAWDSRRVGCPLSQPPETGLGLTAQRPQTRLFAFVCASSAKGPTNAQLIVATAVIASGEQSLLASRLRSELGVAYSFTSRLIPIWDTPYTLWLFETDTPTSSLQETIGEIRSITAAASTRMTEPLFESSRAIQANARINRASDGLQWVTSVLWRGVSPEQEAAMIRAVTLDQAKAALRSVWGPGRLWVVHSADPSPP